MARCTIINVFFTLLFIVDNATSMEEHVQTHHVTVNTTVIDPVAHKDHNPVISAPIHQNISHTINSTVAHFDRNIATIPHPGPWPNATLATNATHMEPAHVIPSVPKSNLTMIPFDQRSANGTDINFNLEEEEQQSPLGPCSQSCYEDMFEDWVEVTKEINVTATGSLDPTSMLQNPKARAIFCTDEYPDTNSCLKNCTLESYQDAIRKSFGPYRYICEEHAKEIMNVSSCLANATNDSLKSGCKSHWEQFTIARDKFGSLQNAGDKEKVQATQQICSAASAWSQCSDGQVQKSCGLAAASLTRGLHLTTLDNLELMLWVQNSSQALATPSSCKEFRAWLKSSANVPLIVPLSHPTAVNVSGMPAATTTGPSGFATHVSSPSILSVLVICGFSLILSR